MKFYIELHSTRGLVYCTWTKARTLSRCQTSWWCHCKSDTPDLLWSSRGCLAIIQLEACSRSTSHYLDSSDPLGHGNTGDWCSGADSWQIVLATNRNGGILWL